MSVYRSINLSIYHSIIFFSFLCLPQWCLVEYTAGGQEFVLPQSIRPLRRNRLCSVETLTRLYGSEEQNVGLQVGARDTHLPWVCKHLAAAAASPL